MPTFMMSLNWTDQGIRAVKDSPKRSEAARELAKKVGVEIKHLSRTSWCCLVSRSHRLKRPGPAFLRRLWSRLAREISRRAHG